MGVLAHKSSAWRCPARPDWVAGTRRVASAGRLRLPPSTPLWLGTPARPGYPRGRPPPLLPLQNFEQYDDDSAGLAPSGSRSRPIADPNFIGYTYKAWDAVHSKEGASLTRRGAAPAGLAHGACAGCGAQQGVCNPRLRSVRAGGRRFLATMRGINSWGRPQPSSAGKGRRHAHPASNLHCCVRWPSPQRCSQAAGEGAAHSRTTQHQPAGGSLWRCQHSVTSLSWWHLPRPLSQQPAAAFNFTPHAA